MAGNMSGMFDFPQEEHCLRWGEGRVEKGILGEHHESLVRDSVVAKWKLDKQDEMPV